MNNQEKSLACSQASLNRNKRTLGWTPLYEAVGRNLREAYHFHADKEGWHLFVKIDDKGNYNWFMWVFISKDVVLFVLEPTLLFPRYHVKAYLI